MNDGERIRVHTKVRISRRGRVNGSLEMAAVTHILPWAPALDGDRWDRLKAIEGRLPHPMEMTADEQWVGASNPTVGVMALLREPLGGMEWRVFMSRN